MNIEMENTYILEIKNSKEKKTEILMQILTLINDGLDLGQLTVALLRLFIENNIPIPLNGHKDPVLNALSVFRMLGSSEEKEIAKVRLAPAAKELGPSAQGE